MPKLPVLRPYQGITALEKGSFRQVFQRGSHVQLERGNLLVTVPVHPGDLNLQTLHSILRQAQPTAEEFMVLL
jgi:predicted RNA binding protein YcfA (HicA-like mRNA interferase family)